MEKLITLKDLSDQINVPLDTVQRLSRNHADFPQVVKLMKPKDHSARPTKHYSQSQINAWLKKYPPKKPDKPNSGLDNRMAAWFLAGMPKPQSQKSKKKTVTVHVNGDW